MIVLTENLDERQGSKMQERVK